MTPDIWVDFNEIDEDGITETLLEFAVSDTPLVVGNELTAGDEDGNWGPAVVESISDDLVTLRLDLSRIHRISLSEFAKRFTSCS